MRRGLCCVLLAAACGGGPPPPTDPSALLATLQDLAAFGPKHVGTDGNERAAAYLEGRLGAIGLKDVHREAFAFPRWELGASSMTVTVDGQAVAAPFDVFEASGGGHVDADVVWAHHARDDELAGVDLAGKVALVVRDPSFHRAAQLRNVAAHGGAAMLYLSIAPQNLRQVGSVRYGWEAQAAIPAVTIGADDGAVLQAAVTGGKAVHVVLDVRVDSLPATGHNLVAVLPGERAEQIVVGAHYDTWFTGSTDNGGGVAELLALAARRVARGQPRYTLTFVAYDGEEVALYGGYDFLRRHKVVGDEPILAVLNFESPSALDANLAGLAHSNQPALDQALQAGGLNVLYVLYLGMEAVAGFFGGIIPTDIQGTYRGGVPTVSTAVSGPYYHTTEDTPDKVDLPLLATSTDEFDVALETMMKDEPAAFAAGDPKLWTAEVTVSGADPLLVDALVRDGSGAPQADAAARLDLLVDDFTLVDTRSVKTDGDGHARFEVPAATAAMGSGRRFVHVAAGPTYPLVEKIVALPET